MDISKIFSLFSKNEDISGEPINITSYEDFTSTPVYWVGMFRKLIQTYHNVGLQFMDGLVKDNNNFNSEDMAKAYEFMTYSRAYSYMENFKLDNEEHKNILKRFTNKDLISSLNMSIFYFEDLEEFEKCLTLKEILDFCEETSQKT